MIKHKLQKHNVSASYLLKTQSYNRLSTLDITDLKKPGEILYDVSCLFNTHQLINDSPNVSSISEANSFALEVLS